MSLTPKRAVSAEAIDAVDELDKEVRRSTYKRKRTILFLVKIVLFVLLWTAFRSFLFTITKNGEIIDQVSGRADAEEYSVLFYSDYLHYSVARFYATE